MAQVFFFFFLFNWVKLLNKWTKDIMLCVRLGCLHYKRVRKFYVRLISNKFNTALIWLSMLQHCLLVQHSTPGMRDKRLGIHTFSGKCIMCECICVCIYIYIYILLHRAILTIHLAHRQKLCKNMSQVIFKATIPDQNISNSVIG